MAMEYGMERAAAEMLTTRATRSGKIAAAASDCMPPSDEPTDACSWMSCKP